MKIEISETGAQTGDIWEYQENATGTTKKVLLVTLLENKQNWIALDLETGQFIFNGGYFTYGWSLISRLKVLPDSGHKNFLTSIRNLLK